MKRNENLIKATAVVAVVAAIVISLFACSRGERQRPVDEKSVAQDTSSMAGAAMNENAEVSVRCDGAESQNVDSLSGRRSLNDIRFASFEDKDWLDNDYLRALRCYLDAFRSRQVDNEDLEPYRDVVQGKFVVFNLAPFIGGGLFLQITFYEHPDYLFAAWVYSDVDLETETVTGYNVKSVRLQDDQMDITQEEIQEVLDEHPELKLW